MTEEFNLSKNIMILTNPLFKDGEIDNMVLMSKDVKEFIRLLKEEIKPICVDREINKLAGEKLK